MYDLAWDLVIFRASNFFKLDSMVYNYLFIYLFSEPVDSCRDLMHIVFVHYLEIKVIHFFIIVAASFVVIVIAVLNFSR